MEQFDVRIVPDFGERAFEHVAEGMVAPELVGVDFAVPRDTADAATGFNNVSSSIQQLF